MKRNKLFLSLSGLLLLTLIIASLSVNVKGASTLDFIFEKDVLYSKSNPEFDDSFNVRNQTTYNGHYNATYSFRGEVGLTNSLISFVGIDFSNHSEVVSNVNGHEDVLSFYDDEGSNNFYSEEFQFQLNGTIEFWVNIVNTTTQIRLYFKEDGTSCFYIRWNIDKIHASAIPKEDISDNTWYHVKVEWFNNDKWDLYMNGILINEGGAMDNGMVNGINRLQIVSYQNNPTNFIYFDAIGYYWHNTTLFKSYPIADGGVNQWDNTGGSDHYLDIDDDVIQPDTGDADYIYTNADGEIEEFNLLNNNSIVFNYVIWFAADLSGIGHEKDLAISIDYNDGEGWNSLGAVYMNANDSLKYYNKSVFNVRKIGIDWKIKFTTPDLLSAQIIIYVLYLDFYVITEETDYKISDNIVPYFNVSQIIKETNAYSFSYTEEGIFTVAENYIPFWTEVNGTDDGLGRETTVNGRARLQSSSTWDKGFYKNDFTILDGIINISWDMEYDYMEAIDGIFYLNVYSENTILKTRLRFHVWCTEPNPITTMSYYDGSNYHNLTDLEEDVIYGFSLMILPINLIYLRNNVELINVFQGITTNKGLSKIEFVGNAGIHGGGEFERMQRLYIDNVGIYSNGTSLSNDYMSGIINISADWDSNNYFIFESNIIGVCSISANLEVLYSNYNYSGKTILNVWDKFTGEDIEGEEIFYLIDCNITFVSNTLISIISLSIDGVILTEGINEYFFDFSYSSVNINKSYFWVDSNNRLQFKLTVDDDNLEYIQATFDVQDVASENRSISFTSNINGESKGFFSLDYTDDTINLIEFPYHQTTTKVILPQTKTIDNFTILITDNDLDDNDLCTGHITNVRLLYNPDIEITIITITLLGIIVPLMIMVIPSIIMSKKFGIAGTIIMFLLMSLVCVIGNLIPIWMFAIIAFCTIGFLLLKEKIEVRI